MRNVPRKLFFIALFTIMLLPMWFLFTTSIMTTARVLVMPPPLFPKTPTWAAYSFLLRNQNIAQWGLNTIIVVGATVLGSTIVSAMTGYVFALYNFPGKKLLWAILLFGVMIPRISMVIPLFVVSRKLRVSGTLQSCIIPFLLNPAGIYLARAYFASIPRSIIEAARIDGASDVSILLHVGVPLCGPIFAALGLGSGITALNDWLWQALQLQGDNVKTMLVGLLRLAMTRGAGEVVSNYIGRSCAAGIILLAPMVLIFVLANRYFVSSLGGAIKE